MSLNCKFLGTSPVLSEIRVDGPYTQKIYAQIDRKQKDWKTDTQANRKEKKNSPIHIKTEEQTKKQGNGYIDNQTKRSAEKDKHIKPKNRETGLQTER